MKWQEWKEAGRVGYLWISMELASINTRSCLVRSPLSTSSLRWNLTRCPGTITWAPACPSPPFAHSKARTGGACGGLRVSAEPSGRRAAVCPARRLKQREVRFLKRPLPPRARLCARRRHFEPTYSLGCGGRKVLRLSHPSPGVVELVLFCGGEPKRPNAQEPGNDI